MISERPYGLTERLQHLLAHALLSFAIIIWECANMTFSNAQKLRRDILKEVEHVKKDDAPGSETAHFDRIDDLMKE
jgi:hypothetical protein